MQVQKTVFISYRRTNMYMARAVYQDLRTRGYDAFLDYQSLDSGDFSQSLLSQIAARAHFVVILTPSALERCTSTDDWLRKEIEYAIEQKRNVVPLLFEGFKFEDVGHYLVSDWLKMLPNYNGLRIPDDYFDEAMARLCGSRYLERDVETVLHPVAAQVAQAAQAAQAEADAAPAPTPDQLEAEQHFENGYRRLRLMSDYAGAIEEFTRVISLRPDYADAYHWRGRAYWNKGDKTNALLDWKQAIQLKPDDPRVTIIRSAIARVEGNLTLMLNEAETGVQLNPNFDEAYLQRGIARAETKDFEGALADIDTVIQLNPQHSMAYFSRGLTHYMKRNYEQAIADYGEAIRLNPDYAEAYTGCGNARFMKREFEQAIADYEQVLRIDPTHELAKKNLALARQVKSDP